MKDYQYLEQKYRVNTYANRGLTLVKGSGMYLYDQKNAAYLDMMSNIGVSIFGYNHPSVYKTLQRQLKKLSMLHGSFTNDIRAEVSELLVKRCGSNYRQVYWSNSGAEAIEAALKFAVLATKKRKFIACKNSYHGKTLGALSATFGDKYREVFMPLLWEFDHVDFNDLKALAAVIDVDTAAFIVEPIQGEGGIVVPSKDYLSEVRKICNKKGILLIIDEIQTGCGRTGRFLASEKDGVAADILCLGKGLAGGMPVGATIITSDIAKAIPKHIHTSTFGGNPLTSAGVAATFELLDEGILNHVKELGKYFIKQLRLLKSDLIVEVRGEGLMIGMQMKEQRNKVLKLLQDERILAIPAGEDVVRFLPPYIIEKKHVAVVIEKLKQIEFRIV